MKKPKTSKDFLEIITTIQSLVEKGKSYHMNDRNPNGFELGNKSLEEAIELCLEVRSMFPVTGYIKDYKEKV